MLPYNGDATSAAAAIRDVELEQPCDAADRRRHPLFCDESGAPFTYAVLHAELRKLLAALYGDRFAAAFSWHSIRIGLACALHAADCPDAVIQLICRWANPASLKVYRQIGIEKNVFWTDRAQHVTFDATRVNNIPALDNDEALLRNAEAFTEGAPAPPPIARQEAPPVSNFVIPGGTVQATMSDRNGLVGLTVGIFNNFWPGYETNYGRTPCLVKARCMREFKHPDGERCLTYLIEWNGELFPIKHAALVSCVAQGTRRTLPSQLTTCL